MDVYQEKLYCVDSAQILEVDNNKWTQVETNMSAKSVKFAGDMFRVDILREEVLEKCKMSKVVKSDTPMFGVKTKPRVHHSYV